MCAHLLVAVPSVMSCSHSVDWVRSCLDGYWPSIVIVVAVVVSGLPGLQLHLVFSPTSVSCGSAGYWHTYNNGHFMEERDRHTTEVRTKVCIMISQ